MRNWMLPCFPDNYRRERDSNEREYYTGLRREWDFRVNESNALHDDLVRLGAPLVDCVSLTLSQQNMHQYERAVTKKKKEKERIIWWYFVGPSITCYSWQKSWPPQRNDNSLRQNETMSSTTRTTCQSECLYGMCIMSRVKSIMLVALVFNMQCMHIGDIV